MITVGQACVLGAVQGLTEFLPISSDGHLAVMHRLIAPMPAAETLAVDVALHAGTLVATIAYFRRDLVRLGAAMLTPGSGGWPRRWIWLLAAGSLPVAIVGGLWRHQIEATFTSMTVVGVGFLVTGAFLFIAGWIRNTTRDETEVGLRDALVIGTFQAFALLPGISRSGSTIAAALVSRLRPDVAARFRFLLGIPAVLGAELLEARAVAGLDPASLQAVAAGTLVAMVTGLVAIVLLMRVMASHRLYYFAYYLWPLGVLVLAMSRGTGG
jgi:undecaprenyl-diphosphatase